MAGMSITSYRDEPPTSPSLLARARQGDSDGWRQLAQIYGPVVYGWARRCGCQAADAADVMQETFAAVAKAFSRFDDAREGATFRGWLWTISRNKIRDRARGRGEEAVGGTQAYVALKQIPAAELSDGQNPESSAVDDDEPPTSAADDYADSRRRLIELIRQKFDGRTWQMFWETSIIGRPPADVADELGVSKWAVYKARARVLQRLQEEMQGLE